MAETKMPRINTPNRPPPAATEGGSIITKGSGGVPTPASGGIEGATFPQDMPDGIWKMEDTLVASMSEFISKQTSSKATNMNVDMSEGNKKKATAAMYAGLAAGFAEQSDFYIKQGTVGSAFESHYEDLVVAGMELLGERGPVEMFMYTFNLIAAWVGPPKLGTLKKAHLDSGSVAQNRKEKLSAIAAQVEAVGMEKFRQEAGFGKRMVNAVFIASNVVIHRPGGPDHMFKGNMDRVVIHRAVTIFCVNNINTNAANLSATESPTGRTIKSAGLVVDSAKMPSLLWTLYAIRDFSGDLPGEIGRAVQAGKYAFAPEADHECEYFAWLASVVFSISCRGRDHKESGFSKGTRQDDPTVGKYMDLKALEEGRSNGEPYTADKLYEIAKARKFTWTRV
jgi:hypothetical protein